MKVPTLERFLCCMSLKTGGTAVGWLGIVISSAEFLSGTKSFILAAGRTVNDNHDNGSPFAKLATSVIFFITYVLYCGLFIYSSWLLIEGTKEGRHKKMILIMVLFSVDIIFNIVLLVNSLIIWNTFTLSCNLVSIALHSYFLLVIFSLYKSLQVNDTQAQATSKSPNSA